MQYILLGLIGLIVALGFYFFIANVVRSFSYKRGNNPYHRICKKCGAHQVVYESCFGTWWGEVYPIGNNPSCKCHKDVEDRDW